MKKIFIGISLLFLFNISCTKEYYTEIIEVVEEAPVLIEEIFISELLLKSEVNPLLLIEDIVCIVNENTISARIPYIVKYTKLIPNFKTGEEVKIINLTTEEEIISGETPFDFSQPLKIKAVSKTGEERIYEIKISVYTELPIIFINTIDNKPVNQKTTYIDGKFSMYNNLTFTNPSDFVEKKIGIKGRGNSTWDMPQKPYKIKFDKKISFFGLAEHKHWVLLADYADKTQLRNKMGFYMGSISDLAWSPSGNHVEAFLNEEYIGTYLLCEQIKAGEGRVNIGENGYILEIDARVGSDPEDIYFTTSVKKMNIVIKEPEVTIGDEKYNWIVNYFKEFEDVLFNYSSDKSIHDYIDLSSFVDWFIINEITKNNDAIEFSSCYFNLRQGGLIKKGPVWDFDISLGNINYNNNEDPTGFWIAKSSIYTQLLKNTIFVDAVKERFKYFYSKKNDMLLFINNNASGLKWAIIENNSKWNNLYKYSWPNYAVWGTYDNEVTYMKDWLNKRLDWLDENINKL